MLVMFHLNALKYKYIINNCKQKDIITLSYLFIIFKNLVQIHSAE